MKEKIASEKLFEKYLLQINRSFEYEPEIHGKNRKPDYLIKVGNRQIFCEVKQFDKNKTDKMLEFNRVVTMPNPADRIREKINQACKQFREFKDFPCVLILSNEGSSITIDLSEVSITQAMHGNINYVIYTDKETGEVKRKGWEIGPNKRKLRINQNTTLSVIAVLGVYPPYGDKYRLTIYYNPYANIKLDTDIFNGCNDINLYFNLKTAIWESPLPHF